MDNEDMKNNEYDKLWEKVSDNKMINKEKDSEFFCYLSDSDSDEDIIITGIAF